MQIAIEPTFIVEQLPIYYDNIPCFKTKYGGQRLVIDKLEIKLMYI